MKIKPLFDRVVLKPIQNESKTSSGLVLAESNAEKPLLAQVITVGNGIEADGKPVEMQVNVGDKVIYSRYGGIEFKLDGQTYVIIRQSDILMVLED